MGEVGSRGGVSLDQMAAAVAPLALKAEMPTPATSAPPSVADSSAKGTGDSVYALSDHTHASKARKIRAQCATDGTLTWTFNPPFSSGVTPIITAVAETGVGVTDVVNVQVEGTPTSTSAKLRVNRTNKSNSALLSLTVLSVPASVGVTWVHAIALEP